MSYTDIFVNYAEYRIRSLEVFFIISLKSVTVKTMSVNFDRFTIIVTQNARTSLNLTKFLNGDGVGRGRNIAVIRRGIVKVYRPSIVEGPWRSGRASRVNFASGFQFNSRIFMVTRTKREQSGARPRTAPTNYP